MQFHELLDKYRKEGFNTRDQGDKFEQLMQDYLLTEPTYRGVLKRVWLWGEFPYREQLGSQDTGIDLVAETADGEYWAVQVKFFLGTGTIDKAMVDTFLSTSFKSFTLDNGEEKYFANRLFIYTADKWSSTAEDTLKNQQIPVTRIGYGDLSVSEVDWEALEKGVHGDKARGAKKSPRAHQIEAIDKTNVHFEENERGKLPSCAKQPTLKCSCNSILKAS